MRNKILAANWKMNLTQPEVDHWLQVFEDNYWDAIGKELRLYPGSLYIQKLASTAHVGAQNFYFESKGAFTGEISLAQLKSVGAQSVLIGHSERREIFNENAQLVRKKVHACAADSFPLILCCGETLSVRNENSHLAFIQEQLLYSLNDFPLNQLDLLTIAYEPIWAIGTGLSADIGQISEMHVSIRNILLELFGNAGQTIPILYGGSVTPENASDIFRCSAVSGALVGGASLDPIMFHQIWEQL